MAGTATRRGVQLRCKKMQLRCKQAHLPQASPSTSETCLARRDYAPSDAYLLKRPNKPAFPNVYTYERLRFACPKALDQKH